MTDKNVVTYLVHSIPHFWGERVSPPRGRLNGTLFPSQGAEELLKSMFSPGGKQSGNSFAGDAMLWPINLESWYFN